MCVLGGRVSTALGSSHKPTGPPHPPKQARFAALLAAATRHAHATLTAAKSELEATRLEGSPGDATHAITAIHRAHTQTAPALGARVRTLEAGERLLRRQRFAFPGDWPQASLAAGALEDLGQILARRLAGVEARKGPLREMVLGEDRAVQQRLRALGGEWAAARPLHVRSVLCGGWRRCLVVIV